MANHSFGVADIGLWCFNADFCRFPGPVATGGVFHFGLECGRTGDAFCAAAHSRAGSELESSPSCRRLAGRLRLHKRSVCGLDVGVAVGRQPGDWVQRVAQGSYLEQEADALNPVSQEAQALDVAQVATWATRIPALVVITAPDLQAVLQKAERASGVLQQLTAQGGLIAGFETPTRFLPSMLDYK